MALGTIDKLPYHDDVDLGVDKLPYGQIIQCSTFVRTFCGYHSHNACMSSCGTSPTVASKNTTTTSSSIVTGHASTPTTPLHSLPGRPAFGSPLVTFVSPSVRWASGPSIIALNAGLGPGTLARTSNNGKTWSRVATPGVNFRANGSNNPSSYANGARFAKSKLSFWSNSTC